MSSTYDDNNENETFYVVKVLKAIDQYQTEYRALYLGEQNCLVANISNARKYKDFNYAYDDSRMITEKYKCVKEWAPAYVITKKERRNYDDKNYSNSKRINDDRDYNETDDFNDDYNDEYNDKD